MFSSCFTFFSRRIDVNVMKRLQPETDSSPGWDKVSFKEFIFLCVFLRVTQVC